MAAERRTRKLWSRYRMTPEDWELIWESQQGCCDICRRKLEKLGIGTCVDHDHKTGFVRGILCADCNHGLGAFKDNVDFLDHAATYLLTHGERYSIREDSVGSAAA